MIKTYFQTFKIDLYYSVNSFLYLLKRLPIFKDLFTNDIYHNSILKGIVGCIGILVSFIRALTFKFLYYYIIYLVSISMSSTTDSFLHVFFFLTILGMFINNKFLNVGKKKYFALITFQMDGKKFFQSNLLLSFISNLFFNGIALYIFAYHLLHYSFFEMIVLLLFVVLIRYIGEYLNILFFRKNHYIWYSNTKIYYPIFISLLGFCFLPYLSIAIPFSIVEFISFLVYVVGIYCFIQMFLMDDYLFLYKQVQKMTEVMNSENQSDYLKQSMIEVKDKDRVIDTKLIENKHGYDLFNTIFFERHKEILLRSAKRYSLFLGIFYVVMIYIMIHYSNYQQSISNFLHYNLAAFIIVMFYINRGSIITRAMFFNCDHAMLRYNFYREPSIMLELFKKRVMTVVKVNLIPAFVIGIGNSILLVLSNSWNIQILFTTFLFIISLSVFFSVHYLVIYYLLQPYNKEMEAKKIGYSIATISTYVISFWLKDIVLSSSILSILGVFFVILYLVLSLFLVYKIAPRTFKLY